MTSTAVVVRLTGVSKLYQNRREGASGVRDVNLAVRPGELVLLLGPSGSGKTTLLTLAAGLLKPTAGTVELFGRDIFALPDPELQQLRALHMGFVFQTFRLIDALTVEENVSMVRRLARRGNGGTGRNGADLLERFGLGGLRRAFPPTLSQGEKQRVAIARALANDPELIIADEPTASISTDAGLEVIGILRDAAASCGKSVLVATHDLRLREHADRVISLRDGRIIGTEAAPGSSEALLPGGIEGRAACAG